MGSTTLESPPHLAMPCLDTLPVVLCARACCNNSGLYALRPPLFPQPPQEFLDDDIRPEDELREDQTQPHAETPRCSGSTTSDRHESPSSETRHAQETEASQRSCSTFAGLDWHRACARNRRICNSPAEETATLSRAPAGTSSACAYLAKYCSDKGIFSPTRRNFADACDVAVSMFAVGKHSTPDDPMHLGFKKQHSSGVCQGPSRLLCVYARLEAHTSRYIMRSGTRPALSGRSRTPTEGCSVAPVVCAAELHTTAAGVIATAGV